MTTSTGRDRGFCASNWASYFQPSDDVLQRAIAGVRELPLQDEVEEKWLYSNVAQLFNLE